MYEYKSDPYSSHSKILKLSKSLREKNPEVLDIGCAQGYIARELKEKGHSITGIELDESSASLAKDYCKKLIIGDIETLNPQLKKESFDLIIFGDILEHTKDPEAVLKKYLQFLRQGSYAIISVPNIANIHIRLSLLFGRFNYSQKGILDKTHLRFFTLKTFKRLIKKSNLKLLKLEPAPIPLPLVFPSTAKSNIFHFIHKINYLFTKLWKKMFAYQFIILAKK